MTRENEMKKKILLFVTLFSVYIQSYAIELKVPIGAKGYLGEVAPPVSSASTYLHTSPDLGANSLYYSISLRRQGVIGDLENFPEINTSGIEFVNMTNPDSGSIALTINGTLNASFLRYDGKTVQNVSATMVNGRNTSLNGLYKFQNEYRTSDASWGIAPRTGRKNFFTHTYSDDINPTIFTVSSYSAYAIGNGLKPGVYKLKPSYIGVNLVASGWGVTESISLFDQNSDVTITALKSCKLTPSTQTNVQYPTQLSQNYPTPKNLASEQAVVQVNCYDEGKEGFLTLGALNPMVSGSSTGMVLTSSESNAGDLPYIATSATSQGDSVCNANSSDAIPYIGSQSISTIPSQHFTKSLFFNLCANGNIKPGKYKGAINVSVLID